MENVPIVFEKYFSLFAEGKTPENDVLNEIGRIAENLSESVVIDGFPVWDRTLPRLTELIVSFGLVKTFEETEDRDYGPEDFPDQAENAVKCFEYLHYLLMYYEQMSTSTKRKFLVQVVMLCATHYQNYLWSSEKSVEKANTFLKNVMSYSKHNNLNALLCDETFHPTIFKAILKWMTPSLTKGSWMKNPSSCHIFYWLLSHVKHPDLEGYLYDVLPPSFMFCNYFALPQQILGIKCFHHILDNVPPSLIKANGIEHAMFDTLKKYQYIKEIPMIEVLYSCLLKLPMMKSSVCLTWLKCDSIFQHLIKSAEMEGNPKLRLLFLNQIYIYIQRISCFKHLKITIELLMKNFTANSPEEEECRIVCLKIIKELIRTCWPRMEKHCIGVLFAIIKVIHDIEKSYFVKKNSKESYALCVDCLRQLRYSCPKTFRSLVNEYIKFDDTMPGVTLLKSIR